MMDDESERRKEEELRIPYNQPGGLCSDRQSGGGGSLGSKGKREGVYKVKHVVVRRDCFPG